MVVTLVLGAALVALPLAYALSYDPLVNVTELGLFDTSSSERIEQFEL